MKTSTTERKKCDCGVPLDVHGTMCGWQSAKVLYVNGVIAEPEHPSYRGVTLSWSSLDRRADSLATYAANGFTESPMPLKEDMDFVDPTTGAFREDKFNDAMDAYLNPQS